MATNEELERLVQTLNLDEVPAKLKCSCCSQFVGLSVFRLPCCDQSVCQSCKETIKENCPVCDHSPLDPADIIGSKAQRLTAKAFLKGELRKREEAEQKARKAQQAAEAKVLEPSTATAEADPAAQVQPQLAAADESANPSEIEAGISADTVTDFGHAQATKDDSETTPAPPQSPEKPMDSNLQAPQEQDSAEQQTDEQFQQQRQTSEFGSQMLNPNMTFGGMPNMNWAGGAMFNPMMGAFGMGYPNMMNANMGMDPSMMMANGMFGGMGGPGMGMNDMNPMAMNETNGGWNEENAANGMNGSFEDYSSGFFQGNGFNPHGMSSRGRFVQRPYRNYSRGRGRGGYFSPFQGPRGAAHFSPGVAGAPTGPRAANYSHTHHQQPHPLQHQQGAPAAEGSESMHSNHYADDGVGDMQPESEFQVAMNGHSFDHVDGEPNVASNKPVTDVETDVEIHQDSGKHVHGSPQPPPSAPTGPAAMTGLVRPVDPTGRGVVGAPTGPKAMRTGTPNTSFRGRGGMAILGRGGNANHSGPDRSMSMDQTDNEINPDQGTTEDILQVNDSKSHRQKDPTSKYDEDDSRHDDGHTSSRRSSKYDRDYERDYDRDRESRHRRRRRHRDENSHDGHSSEEGGRRSSHAHRHERERNGDREKGRSKYRERDDYDEDSHRHKHKSGSSRRGRDRSQSPHRERRHSPRRDRDRDRDRDKERDLPASIPTGPSSKSTSRRSTTQEFKIKDRSKTATSSTLDALRDRVRHEKPDIDDYALDREARNRERLLREQQRRTGHGLDGSSERYSSRKRSSRAAGMDEDEDASLQHDEDRRRRRGSKMSRRVSYIGEDEDEVRARRVESEREAARWG